MSPNRESETGAALVWVVWILIVLSGLALATMRLAATSYKSAAIDVARAEARHLAEAGIHRAVADILANSRGRDLPKNRSYRIFESNVAVSIRHEAGKINLNRAGERLLAAAFAANGVEEAEAEALAARIVDWRDTDDLPRPNGAEFLQYRRAGYAYEPRNGPFETVGELLQLLGMTRELYTCVRPALTVYSSGAEPVDAYAPKPVREIYQWAETAQWFAREDGSSRPRRSLMNPNRGRAGAAVEITATAESRDVPVSVRAILRLTGDRREPFQLLSLREIYKRSGSLGCERNGKALADTHQLSEAEFD